MFMNRKTQYCQDVSSSQFHQQINPSQKFKPLAQRSLIIETQGNVCHALTVNLLEVAEHHSRIVCKTVVRVRQFFTRLSKIKFACGFKRVVCKTDTHAEVLREKPLPASTQT